VSCWSILPVTFHYWAFKFTIFIHSSKALFFRKSRIVVPFVFKIKTWQVLRTPCWVLLYVLLRRTDGILKLSFSTGILSCRRDRLRHFNSVNSNYVFLLADFVHISCLTQ